MESLSDFEDRVDELLVEHVGSEGLVMFLSAKSGGVFNRHYDDASLRTEEEARRVAAYIVQQTRRDDVFMSEALSKLSAGGL